MTHELPLTGAQLGIWNAQRLEPDSPYYLVGEVLEIDGFASDHKIDITVLLDAVSATVDEASALSTLSRLLIAAAKRPATISPRNPTGISRRMKRKKTARSPSSGSPGKIGPCTCSSVHSSKPTTRKSSTTGQPMRLERMTAHVALRGVRQVNIRCARS